MVAIRIQKTAQNVDVQTVGVEHFATKLADQMVTCNLNKSFLIQLLVADLYNKKTFILISCILSSRQNYTKNVLL